MENKVIIEGIILNELKLTEFNSCLMRLQNKRTFTKKDGSKGESSCTVVVSLGGKVAQQVIQRFARGNVVRVEGSLTLKKTKNLDQEGREIYEHWIQAMSVNAIPGITEGKPFSTQASAQQNLSYQAVKQPTPVFKKQVNLPYNNKPQPPSEIPFNDEDPFGDRNGDPLPF